MLLKHDLKKMGANEVSEGSITFGLLNPILKPGYLELLMDLHDRGSWLPGFEIAP
jgi:hypothetical protein